MLFSTSIHSQQVWNKKDQADYFYLSATFDANKAFGLKDNPRTDHDNRGFDYDLEFGFRKDFGAVYTFYGAFNEIDYQIYGAGVDLYIQPLRNSKMNIGNTLIYDGIEFSIGAYYSEVIRSNRYDQHGSFTAWFNPRAKILIWRGNFALEFVGKLQNRPELGKYIGEGSIGLTYKFDR